MSAMSEHQISDAMQRLRREVANYQRLLEIQRQIGSGRNIDELPAAVMGDISAMLDAERSSLFVFDSRAMAFGSSFARWCGLLELRSLCNCSKDISFMQSSAFDRNEVGVSSSR